EAFRHTGRYDVSIYGTLEQFSPANGAFVRRSGRTERDSFSFELDKRRDLRYGENPHQRASLWGPRDAPLGLTFVQGKELSYTNLLDLEAASRIVAEFNEPAATVIKHTNPCGAAIG